MFVHVMYHVVQVAVNLLTENYSLKMEQCDDVTATCQNTWNEFTTYPSLCRFLSLITLLSRVSLEQMNIFDNL